MRLRISLHIGNVNHGKFGFINGQLTVQIVRADEHITCKQGVPCVLGNDTYRQFVGFIRTSKQVLNKDFLAS